VIFKTKFSSQVKVLRFPKSRPQADRFGNSEIPDSPLQLRVDFDQTAMARNARSGEETITTTLNSRRATCQHHQTLLTDYKETLPSPLWPQASSTTHVATQSNVYVRACVATPASRGMPVTCLTITNEINFTRGRYTTSLKTLAAADLMQVLHLKSVTLRQLIALSGSGSGSRTVVKNGSH